VTKVNESAQYIMAVLRPGFRLTTAEIRACAPNARRVSDTLAVLVRRGIVRRCGVRHTADGKTEVIFASDVKPC